MGGHEGKRLRNPTNIPENRVGVQLVQREPVQRVQNCLSRDRAVLGKADPVIETR